MTPSRACAPRAAVRLAAVLGLLWGCTESALTEVDPEDAPGPRVETREVRLEVGALPSWRDTSLTGFALAGDAGFVLLSTLDDVKARPLLRFADFPDSLAVNDSVPAAAVDSFANGSLALSLDTLASTFPGLPFTIEARALDRSFDPQEADWTEARAGEAWTTPGGDLGRLLGSVLVDSISGSATLDLAVSTDSLLRAWRESDGQPGLGLVLREPGGRLSLTSTVLGFDVFTEDAPEGVRRFRSPDVDIFIYDPPQPEPGLRLRLGGLPSWRFYMILELPDTVQGIPLAEATLSHAELAFHPLEAPAPFGPETPFAARRIGLLGDPFELGPRTPIGAAGNLLTVDPDSLALGRPLRVDVTVPVDDFLQEADPPAPLRLGVRGVPDAQALGFSEFASAEHPDPALRPTLLLILTTDPLFELP